MSAAGLALAVMGGAYLAGGLLTLLAPSYRAARLLTAAGAGSRSCWPPSPPSSGTSAAIPSCMS